jgi:phosphate-selective porin OprO and OprP
MKFEGFVYNPKLTYYIQLSFSRGDMDWRGTDNSVNNHSPNIVRDAVIYYNPNKNVRLGFGQTKLPGNRQRVVSSGDLQFADRSIVNATFNIDRDFGFFAHYMTNYFNLRGAITSGEGRNSVASNNGLAWTGRAELLPLGKFTGNNDYIEGDLEREPKPKISLAVTYSLNDRAVRQSGTLGKTTGLFVNPEHWEMICMRQEASEHLKQMRYLSTMDGHGIMNTWSAIMQIPSHKMQRVLCVLSMLEKVI